VRAALSAVWSIGVRVIGAAVEQAELEHHGQRLGDAGVDVGHADRPVGQRGPARWSSVLNTPVGSSTFRPSLIDVVACVAGLVGHGRSRRNPNWEAQRAEGLAVVARVDGR